MRNSSTSNSDPVPPLRRVRDVVIGGAIALMLFEGILVALGALGYVLPSQSPQARGPNQTFEFAGPYYAFSEFRNVVRMNAQGFHDRERHEQKPEGVIRVAVWGDSLVEGFQVDREQLFTSGLEDRLADTLGPRAEVEFVNLGASSARAAGLRSEAVQSYLDEREIDALVVVLHGIMEVSHLLGSEGPGLLPRPIGQPDSATVKPRGLRALLTETLHVDSPLLLLSKARLIVNNGLKDSRPPEFFFFEHEVDAPGRHVAWSRLEALLGDLEAMSADGRPVAVAYAPTLAEVNAVRTGVIETLSPLRVPIDFGRVESKCRQATLAAGLPFWSTTQDLALPEAFTHFQSDKHWTAEGHLRVANALESPVRGWLAALAQVEAPSDDQVRTSPPIAAELQ